MKLSNFFTDKNNLLQREINLLLNHFLLSVFEKSFHRFNILIFCLNIWNSISSNFMSITDSPPLHKNDCLPISASEASLELSRVILCERSQSQLGIWPTRPWICIFSGAWTLLFQVFSRSNMPLNISTDLRRIQLATCQGNKTYIDTHMCNFLSFQNTKTKSFCDTIKNRTVGFLRRSSFLSN